MECFTIWNNIHFPLAIHPIVFFFFSFSSFFKYLDFEIIEGVSEETERNQTDVTTEN